MDFGNIIVFLSIFQAILLIVLLLNKKKVQFPTKQLLFLILGLLYFQFEFLLVRNAATLPSRTLLLSPHGGWLVMGPLLYFFVKSFNQKIPFNDLIWHLTPFLIIAIILPLFISEPIPKRGFDYGMLSVFMYRQLGLSTYNSFYGVIFFLQFLHLGTYIGLSYRYNNKQASDSYSAFIKPLLGISVVTYCCCLLFYSVLLGSSFYGREWDYFMILPTAVFIYYLSYLFLSKPELWRSDLKVQNGKKYERSELSSSEIKAIVRQLDEVIQEDKLFNKPDLSLETLAQRLDISRHKLSQAINRNHDISFNDYINQYRIEEAKQLLIKYNGERSILSIAFEAGFNNKATFNKYFKKLTGETPSAFRKKSEKK